MKIWKQIAFVAVIAAIGYGGWLYYQKQETKDASNTGIRAASQTNAPAGRGGNLPLVVVEPAQEEVINDRLELIGTSRALQSVAITPYTAGTLERFEIKAGDHVEAGSVIAKLDSEAEEIALARAQTALQDAEYTLERMERLRKLNTATQVQVVAAELAVNNARLAVKDAELALSRRTVHSPISGTAGILLVDSGNYITPQTEILRIDDTSKIRMDLYAPERFTSQIRIGQPLKAYSTAIQGKIYEGQIAAIDNMLDEASRTLRIQGVFDNAAGDLLAGMSFSVTLSFPGDSYPSVNPLAIQWGTEGAYIWRIQDDKAQRVPVRIIQRNSNSVLVDGDIAIGDMIVSEGVQSVREGQGVRIKTDETVNKKPQLNKNASNEIIQDKRGAA